VVDWVLAWAASVAATEDPWPSNSSANVLPLGIRELGCAAEEVGPLLLHLVPLVLGIHPFVMGDAQPMALGL